MGEAKKRKANTAGIAKLLEDQFQNDGISISEFGFYDSPEFLAQERENPEYLNNYAKWVLNRPRDQAYEKRARIIVPSIARLLAKALEKDGLEGGCITAAGLLTRIFDRLGIWSFGIAGSAVFEVPSAEIWRGLHSIDHQDFPGAELGHSWVCAPPFMIVDASIRMQNWANQPIKAFLPSAVCAENTQVVRPMVNDVVAARVREEYGMAEGRLDPNLHYRLEDGLRTFGSDFPARASTIGELIIRYTPLAIRLTDVPLFEVNGADGPGRDGREIWEQVIIPEIPSLEIALGEKLHANG